MSSFGVNELTQLGAYGCTVGGKGTLQNAIVIGSQKFNSSPRMSSEISSVGDFESFDYMCKGQIVVKNVKNQGLRFYPEQKAK